MPRKLALYFLLVLLCKSLSASHELGGYISYRHDTLNKYSVFVHVYRDCRGVNLSNPASAVLTISFLNQSGAIFGYVTSVKLTRTHIEDLSIVRNGAKKPCSPLDSNGSGLGFELHLFKATIDLDSAPYKTYFKNSNLASILFQYTRTNYSTGSPPPFYLESELRIKDHSGKYLGLPNSSPEMLMHNPPFQCCNQGRYLTFGMHDTMENDSVKYALAPLKIGFNTPISYSSPFTYQYPITPYCIPPTTIKCTPNPKTNPARGFYFDTLTANCEFTPTKCDEKAPIAFKATEYKNIKGKFIEIGYILYSYTMEVSDYCGYNHSPLIYPAGYQSVYTFAIDKKNSLKFTTDDQLFTPYQTGDTTDIFFPNRPTGSTFTSNRIYSSVDEGLFQWTPDDRWYGKTFKLVAAVKDRNKGSLAGYGAKIITIKFRGQFSDYSIYTFLDKNNNGKKDSLEPILPHVKLGIKYANGKTIYQSSDANGLIKVPVFSAFKVIKTLPGSLWFQNTPFDTLKFYGKDSAFALYMPLHSFPYVTGNIFYDFNSNCAKDTQDVAAANMKVFSDNSVIRTSDQGQFTLYIDTAKTDIHLHYFNTSDTCSNKIVLKNVRLPLDTFIDVGGVPVKPHFDIEVGLNMGIARRGRNFGFKAVLTNNSYADLTKFTGTSFPNITIKYPKKLKYIRAYGAQQIDSANGTIVFYSRNIKILDTIEFNGQFYVDPDSFATNDLLPFKIQLDSNFIDTNVLNNSRFIKHRIIGPYDPNDKFLLSGDSVTPNDEVVYRIDFQNYGTDTAFQVVIIDTLSPFFDPSYVSLLEASSSCKMALNAGVLQFTFPDIMLTDTTTSMEKSKGFVSFKAGFNDKIVQAVSITNAASIYFDFEKPVKTENALVSIVPNTAVQLFKHLFCRSENLHYRYKNNIFSIATYCKLIIQNELGNPNNGIVLERFLHTPSENFITRSIQLPDSLKSGKYRIILQPENPKFMGFNHKSDIFEIEQQTPSWSFNNQICENKPLNFVFKDGNKGDIYINDSLYFYAVTDATLLAKFSFQRSKVSAITSNGCPWTDSAGLTIYAQPKILVSAPTFTCYEQIFTVKTKPDYFYKIYQNEQEIFNYKKDSLFEIIPQRNHNKLKLQIQTDFGCVDSTTFIVNERIKPVFSYTIPDSICKNDSLHITLSGNYRFEVSQRGLVLLNQAAAGNHSISYLNHDPLYIRAVDSFGCFAIDSVPLKGVENDTLILSVNKNSLCSYDTLEIKMQGMPSCNLYINEIYSSEIVENMPHNIILFPGFYKIQAIHTSDLGCKYKSNPIDIQYTPLIGKPTIFRSGDTLFVQKSTYLKQWYFNNTLLTPTDTFDFIVPNENGHYSMEFVDAYGCKTMSTSFAVFWMNSVQHINSRQKPLIYPNPFTDEIHISSHGTTDFTMYNVNGKIVHHLPECENTFTISTKELSAGVYLVRILTDSGLFYTTRILKY